MGPPSCFAEIFMDSGFASHHEPRTVAGDDHSDMASRRDHGVAPVNATLTDPSARMRMDVPDHLQAGEFTEVPERRVRRGSEWM